MRDTLIYIEFRLIGFTRWFSLLAKHADDAQIVDLQNADNKLPTNVSTSNGNIIHESLQIPQTLHDPLSATQYSFVLWSSKTLKLSRLICAYMEYLLLELHFGLCVLMLLFTSSLTYFGCNDILWHRRVRWFIANPSSR